MADVPTPETVEPSQLPIPVNAALPQSEMKAKDADGASDRVVYQLMLHFHKRHLMHSRRDLMELVSPCLRLGTVGRSREGFS